MHTAIHLTNGFCHKDLVKSFIDHLSLSNDLLLIHEGGRWKEFVFDGEPHKVSPVITLEQEYCLFLIPDWDNSGSSRILSIGECECYS